MMSKAVPIASLPVEHADAIPMFGPQAPARMLTWTDAESTTIIGIDSGLMRRRAVPIENGLLRHVGRDPAGAAADIRAGGVGFVASERPA